MVLLLRRRIHHVLIFEYILQSEGDYRLLGASVEILKRYGNQEVVVVSPE